MKHSYTVTTKLWKYEGKAAWYFLNINKETSTIIKARTEPSFGGWGQIKVDVQIGKTKWDTSLFPSKEGFYVLAIKKSVRKSENINEGDQVKITFTPRH